MVVQSSVDSVLIADADPYLCRVFEAKLLKDTQFDVVVTNTGSDACQAALQKSFTVILWDTRLRDTLRHLPRLRALCPQASILLMTTDDQPSLDSELRRLDISEVLVKPFGLDTLLERMRNSQSHPYVPESAANLDFARIGQRLTLASEAGRCITRVLERGSESFVVVGSPRVNEPSDFDAKLPVRVEIIGGDALYSFQSKLLRPLVSPVPAWELPLPIRIHREQRRKQPRVQLSLPIQIEAFSSPNDTSLSQSLSDRIVVGLTEDLSLNGCSVISRKPLQVGMSVRFAIEGLPLSQIEGEGEIVRLQSLAEVDRLTRHQISIQFKDLPSLFRKRLRALVETD